MRVFLDTNLLASSIATRGLCLGEEVRVLFLRRLGLLGPAPKALGNQSLTRDLLIIEMAINAYGTAMHWSDGRVTAS